MTSDSYHAGRTEDAGDLAKLIKAQEERLSPSIGQGIDQASAEVAAKAFRNASRHPDYIKFDLVPFLYEKLDGEKVDVMARKLVDEWTRKPENVQRASLAVGREHNPLDPEPLVKAFCAFRLKQTEQKWKPLDGLGVKKGDRSTVVFMAVEPLNYENGSFAQLGLGQDVCLDGNSTIVVPGNGGGLGFFIDLNL